ncbi:MAG: hypothetical protein A2934_05490 [Candidatus Sungbacteria bacterium RIFCSPLOWO2_01_FULL_47_10]|uniref:Uncharacterized protein n=1 Tax=Candidatus Sungbacteria bacterium RIFCSPLOWO2_01_FULL_47_10 TaxID=1802276 RepID=A0A1G2L1F2_9BACT|nr:MAG: hypothetical protein A2934_05490 [Candidatus Sungbacteria bacterium RIFCSPLOWO2_01_FULL_47_10]
MKKLKDIVEFILSVKNVSLRNETILPRIYILPLNESSLRFVVGDLYKETWGLWKQGRIYLDPTSRIDFQVHEAVHFVQESCGEPFNDEEAWQISELFTMARYPWRYAFITNIVGLFGFLQFWGEVQIR